MKIQILDYPDHLSRFEDQNKCLFVDYNERLVQSIEASKINNVNKISVAGDIEISVDRTKKNELIFSSYTEVRNYDPKTDKINVIVWDEMNNPTIYNELYVVASYDDKFKLRLSHSDKWFEKADKLTINQIPFGKYKIPTIDGVTNGEESFFDTFYDGSPFIMPDVYYGDFMKANRHFSTRPMLSEVALLKKGFCEIGFKLESPLFDLKEVANSYVYLNRKDYGGQDQLDFYKFKGTWDSLGLGNKINGYWRYYLRVKDSDNDKLLTSNGYYETKNITSRISLKGTVKATSTANDEIYIFSGNNEKDFKDNKFLNVTEIKKGDDSTFEIDTTIRVNQGDVLYIATNRKLEEWNLEVDCEPIAKDYTFGDTIDISNELDDGISLLDCLKAFCQRFGAYIEQKNKTITIYPPRTLKIRDQVIEGYYKDYEQEIDDVEKDSLIQLSVNNKIKQEQKYSFKGDKQPFVIDLGNSFTEGETKNINPLYNHVENKKYVWANKHIPYPVKDQDDIVYSVKPFQMGFQFGYFSNENDVLTAIPFNTPILAGDGIITDIKSDYGFYFKNFIKSSLEYLISPIFSVKINDPKEIDLRKRVSFTYEGNRYSGYVAKLDHNGDHAEITIFNHKTIKICDHKVSESGVVNYPEITFDYENGCYEFSIEGDNQSKIEEVDYFIDEKVNGVYHGNFTRINIDNRFGKTCSSQKFRIKAIVYYEDDEVKNVEVFKYFDTENNNPQFDFTIDENGCIDANITKYPESPINDIATEVKYDNGDYVVFNDACTPFDKNVCIKMTFTYSDGASPSIVELCKTKTNIEVVEPDYPSGTFEVNNLALTDIEKVPMSSEVDVLLIDPDGLVKSLIGTPIIEINGQTADEFGKFNLDLSGIEENGELINDLFGIAEANEEAINTNATAIYNLASSVESNTLSIQTNTDSINSNTDWINNFIHNDLELRGFVKSNTDWINDFTPVYKKLANGSTIPISSNFAYSRFGYIGGGFNNKVYDHGIIPGGRNNIARTYAIASGFENQANGTYSVAMGRRCLSNGLASTTFGYLNENNGVASVVWGWKNKLQNVNYSTIAGGSEFEPKVPMNNMLYAPKLSLWMPLIENTSGDFQILVRDRSSSSDGVIQALDFNKIANKEELSEVQEWIKNYKPYNDTELRLLINYNRHFIDSYKPYDDTNLRSLITSNTTAIQSSVKSVNGILPVNGEITLPQNEAYDDTAIQTAISEVNTKATANGQWISEFIPYNDSDLKRSIKSNTDWINKYEPYDDTELRGLINSSSGNYIPSIGGIYKVTNNGAGFIINKGGKRFNVTDYLEMLTLRTSLHERSNNATGTIAAKKYYADEFSVKMDGIGYGSFLAQTPSKFAQWSEDKNNPNSRSTFNLKPNESNIISNKIELRNTSNSRVLSLSDEAIVMRIRKSDNTYSSISLTENGCSISGDWLFYDPETNRTRDLIALVKNLEQRIQSLENG